MAFRTTQVAGRFFPDDKLLLKACVTDLLRQAEDAGRDVPSAPVAIITPHAGYDYCGALTAVAWQASRAAQPDRIAVISPAHGTPVSGVAVPSRHSAVALPGLRVRIDREACRALRRAGLARDDDQPFEAEHGIDTQLPFARSVHSGVPVVPVVVGDADITRVAQVVDALAALPGETLFVLSSDLSHHLPETDAQRRDVRTAGLIEIGQGGMLGSHDACGARVIAGFQTSRFGAGLRAVRLARTTSGRVTGSGDSVVGYGAWAIVSETAPALRDDLRAILLDVARRALVSRATRGTAPDVRVDSFATPLRGVMASFVTLERRGQLRGCTGTLVPFRPLVADVADNAVRAGFADPRFPALRPDELADLTLTVSALTVPRPMSAAPRDDVLAALQPGESGLIVTQGKARGVLLPSVWAALPEPNDFLSTLLRKAGLDPDAWPDDLRFHHFRAESFSAPPAAQAEAA